MDGKVATVVSDVLRVREIIRESGGFTDVSQIAAVLIDQTADKRVRLATIAAASILMLEEEYPDA